MAFAFHHRLATTVATVMLIVPSLFQGARSDAKTVPVMQSPPSSSYDDGGRDLTAAERAGRDTWYFWTAGNEAFWRRLAILTNGNVDLLMYVDSRRHDRRFQTLGVINAPGCVSASAADQYGLWLDDCSPSDHATSLPGSPAGIVGLRRFNNPSFDPAKWNLDAYLRNRGSVEPPYRIGMTCGFCHVGFNPINPPADVNAPDWTNLAPTIGNQYFEEGRLFSMNLTTADFLWHVANRQPPGTSDTSRFATDHINNPSAINAIFNLASRPTFPERMRDGTMRQVPHILKDGADSIGIAGASLRVYLNIGMCSDYSMTLHDPVAGVKKAQQPFDIDHARGTCEDFRRTEARMPDVEAFLKTAKPLELADAPGSAQYLRSDADELRRGKLTFADKCASCHSSKQPPPGTNDATNWYRDAVLADDFLNGNFLSTDQRYPVSLIGTNTARAVASNATRDHIWDQFSSETYKALPSSGTITNLYNPRAPQEPVTFSMPAGGRGYYRPASLASMWATAPYLHNNSVGTYIKDPSLAGRLAAFQDGMEKMLWPERRLGVQSIAVTTTDSSVMLTGTTRVLRVPAGTPIDYIARVDPTEVARLASEFPSLNLALRLTPDDVILDSLLKRNLAPDFILDRGHTFGSDLPDQDKRALIEFLKRF